MMQADMFRRAGGLETLSERHIDEPPPPRVSIVIPTFRRPQRAVAAVRSAMRQSAPGGFEIVIVDNDPAGGAVPVLRGLAATAAAPVILVHEPTPGVASARNAGLRAARGEIIAFLDDDETACDLWLTELLRVMEESGADVVFGPVRAQIEEDAGALSDYFAAFFSREPDHAEGLIDDFYGCGCSLVRRSSLPSPEPFEPRRNETGGEDDLLFQTMAEAGGRFAWAPRAVVIETPERDRVRLGYTLRRAFAYGQGPVQIARHRSPADWGGVAYWMMVGAGQATLFGLASLAAALVRHPGRAFLYRRCAEGLGKVFWIDLLKPRFYGAARIAARTDGLSAGAGRKSPEERTSSALATRSA